jgi:Xaa-Pro dipeptidase
MYGRQAVMKTARYEKIINDMKAKGMEQLHVTSPSSIFYLTGEWIEPGERMLALYINTTGERVLFANELFTVKKDADLHLCEYNDAGDPVKELSRAVSRGCPLGIDKEWPSRFLIRLMDLCPGLSFFNGSFIVDEARMVKDNEEIGLMRFASQINDKVMGDLVEVMAGNYSEKKAAKLLADVYEKYGTDEFSFSPGIAYGPNAASPHHSPDGSLMKEGDTVVIDIGGRTNRYCSDMTRTVFSRKAPDEYRQIYNIVLGANLKAIDMVKPGVKFCDIDKAARQHIEKEGYGDYFTHRTGHGIGIDVHEYPDVGEVNEMIVREGMVFSIEPGIYLPERCGIRIEDLVVVTENGCEVLNHYTKELQVIGRD